MYVFKSEGKSRTDEKLWKPESILISSKFVVVLFESEKKEDGQNVC